MYKQVCQKQAHLFYAQMSVMSSFFQLGMYNFDQRVHALCQQEALARKEGHKIK